MTEPYPGLLRALKVAKVVPDESADERYNVTVYLTREMSTHERTALGHSAPIDTPVGLVYPVPGNKDRIAVYNTTIERIASHKEALRAVATDIEAAGERLRKAEEHERMRVQEQTEAERQELARRRQLLQERADAEREEITRRRQLAEGITFD